MLAKLCTYSLLGIEATPVEVEVDISPSGLPRTTLVGLPEAAVRESTHRIGRALANSGFIRPNDRVVINLAPADLPKNASSFDLPIALGILAASGQVDADVVRKYAMVGELALDGSTRPVRGALSMALSASRSPHVNALLISRESAAEASVVAGVDVIPIDSLTQAYDYVAGNICLPPEPCQVDSLFRQHSQYDVDFADVRGQESAKRAMTISAAGGHNLLMVGPPGSGKTMLAKRVPTILPQLTAEESIETSRIYSAIGQLPDGVPLLARRPFRSPHHTISNAGLVGGGSTPTPGEVSLAHNGVLFLDELPEFMRQTLEVMRQPLEDGQVTISRALSSTTFPASIMLVASLNPCPCGYRGDPRHSCECNPLQIERYMAKISGPLLDRIDIHIEVPAVPFEELRQETEGTSSREMRKEVDAARAIQLRRFTGSKSRHNAKMSSREVRHHCRLASEAAHVLETNVAEMGLSARAHDKILRVARTIADLDGRENIAAADLQEAVAYRSLDRGILDPVYNVAFG